MEKSAFFVVIMLASAILMPYGFLNAQTPSSSEPPSIESILPSSPVREAILELLKPEQWLKTLEQYIRVPRPGSDAKDIEVNQERVSELNIEIGRETGVDIIKFFQFAGKVLVIILESVARLIRGFIPSG